MTNRDDPERMRWARLVFERAERIVTLQPGNAAPLSRGAVALAFLGDAKRATSWIVRALTIDPDDLTTQYNAAAVYSIVGELDTAMHILEAYMHRVADDMIDVIRHEGCLERIRDRPRYEELFPLGLYVCEQ
ncbi:hypothetical protein ACFYE9_12360 [Rhizobium leguminosarum]|uniref:Uncharacterized protein n=2 Tax=Rhizobium leguminosarum TaxID=384 RepID=A0ACD5F775_RHILE|nr:hypothetical protein [Rhizobium leguminosarum]